MTPFTLLVIIVLLPHWGLLWDLMMRPDIATVLFFIHFSSFPATVNWGSGLPKLYDFATAHVGSSISTDYRQWSVFSFSFFYSPFLKAALHSRSRGLDLIIIAGFSCFCHAKKALLCCNMPSCI